MYQVNLKHPEESTEVGIFISDAADETDAGIKALQILEGPNVGLNLSRGYEVTLVRKVNYALIPDTSDVMYG